MCDLSYFLKDKEYHLTIKIKQFQRYACFQLYFTHNSSFRRAIDKLMNVSEDWLAEGYCEREAHMGRGPYAFIKLKSASVEHFKLQLACVQCWINAQDDLLADVLISQGDGANED